MVLFKDKIDIIESTDNDKIKQIVEKCRTYEKEIFTNEDFLNMFDTCKYCVRSNSNKVKNCIKMYAHDIDGITFSLSGIGSDIHIKAVVNFNIRDKEGNNKIVKFSVIIYNGMIKYFCNTGWAPDEKTISEVVTSGTTFYSVDAKVYKIDALLDISKSEYIRINLTENELYTIYECLTNALPQYAKYVLDNIEEKLSKVCS